MKIKLEKKLFDLYSDYRYERKYGSADKAIAIYDAIVSMPGLKKAFAECEKVQARCKERVIFDIGRLYECLTDVKEHLDKMPVFKKDLDGTKIFYNPFACHNKPRSYKYEMVCTVLKLEYIKGNLYLTDICRMNCVGDTIKVYLSDKAKDSIIKKVMNDQLFNARY